MGQAVVIGGGPAGSLAAILLLRAGWRTTLIEQARFPRDKVCGECLSALGQEVLSRHLLLDRVTACGAVPLVRAMLHAADGTSGEFRLPRPMLGISRAALDEQLLAAARDAGATILQPARAESLASIPHGVACHIRSLTGNTITAIKADVAFLADGKSALIPPRPLPTGDLGIKTHLIHVDGPVDTIELFGLRGHYGGLSPVERGRFNTSFSVPADRLRCAGDLDRLLAEMIAENPVLFRRLRRAKRVGDWHVSPLPRFDVRRDWPANIIPIGNAAASIEPIGGEGMGLALRSAELAVAAMLGGTMTELPRRYRELWTIRRLACRAAAKMMASPAWSSRVLSIVRETDPLTHTVLGWIGKT